MSASKNGTAIAARGLGKCYQIYDRPADRLKQALFRWKRQFYREFWALRGVSFEVGRGECLGVIGRNGSGKSTLLQIIAGTLRPSEGQVELSGRVAALLELGSGFNPEFTGRENVFLNGAILGLAQREIERRFDEIAAFADIGEFINQPVKTFSTGMVVRLAFAVQALLEPDVLIVDEALSVGDAAFQSKCFRRINQLRERGVTILLVSHDTLTVATMCDRALLLERGQPAMLDAARAVTQEYYRRVMEAERRDLAGAAAAPTPDDGAAARDGEMEPIVPGRGQRQGDGRAEITGLAILDHTGQPARSLAVRQRFTVRLAVRFNAALDSPQIGVALRNAHNQTLLGAHTMYENVRVGPVSAGQRVTATFTLPADLNAGKYLLMVGVADHASWQTWVENDVIFDYCEIEVYGEPRGWGIVNVPVEVSVQRT